MRLFLFLCCLATACGSPSTSNLSSITGPDYHGKKFYLGWGANGNGNSEMDNEVKYDVLHTHDLFVKEVGGSYQGTKLIGTSEARASAIRSKWESLKGQMTDNDMFLQYSSGHGSQSGLGVGLTYNEIRDFALALPSRETIIFTMACYSGNLVDSFNAKRSEWENTGMRRTLFVMSSSGADEESSTGPGRDPDEANGPDGSAGSAFGHALWKALIGYADANHDKQLTLGEIIQYTVHDTVQEGGHTPVMTGVYDPGLVMAKVPTFADLQDILGDTEELRKIAIDLEM